MNAVVSDSRASLGAIELVDCRVRNITGYVVYGDFNNLSLSGAFSIALRRLHVTLCEFAGVVSAASATAGFALELNGVVEHSNVTSDALVFFSGADVLVGAHGTPQALTVRNVTVLDNGALFDALFYLSSIDTLHFVNVNVSHVLVHNGHADTAILAVAAAKATIDRLSLVDITQTVAGTPLVLLNGGQTLVRELTVRNAVNGTALSCNNDVNVIVTHSQIVNVNNTFGTAAAFQCNSATLSLDSVIVSDCVAQSDVFGYCNACAFNAKHVSQQNNQQNSSDPFVCGAV